MKKKFEEPEMQIIVFGSEDTMCVTSGITSGISLSNMYGGFDGGLLYVEPDDD